MKQRLGTYLLLVFLVLGFYGCTLHDTFVKPFQDDQVVLDAWERGKRAEEKGEYQRAKEEYYFVKRFATTYHLKEKAQERYNAVSRILEETGEKD